MWRASTSGCSARCGSRDDPHVGRRRDRFASYGRTRDERLQSGGELMAKSFASLYRIEPGKRVQLAKRDPRDASALPDREAAEEKSREDAKVINELQDKLYAERTRALLVV